jgi:hypothetical protein
MSKFEPIFAELGKGSEFVVHLVSGTELLDMMLIGSGSGGLRSRMLVDLDAIAAITIVGGSTTLELQPLYRAPATEAPVTPQPLALEPVGA